MTLSLLQDKLSVIFYKIIQNLKISYPLSLMRNFHKKIEESENERKKMGNKIRVVETLWVF